MICPNCQGKTAVINHFNTDGNVTRRRRCEDCKYEFATTELQAEHLDALRRVAREAKSNILTFASITRDPDEETPA